MKVTMGESGVPFVVSYRKIIKKPKIVRHRRFVGAVQMVKNLLAKAIELVEESAFETKTEVVDPGQSVSVHWAVSVEDPWDTTTGAEKNLVAYRMLDDIPPNGVHFEVISPVKESPKPVQEETDSSLGVDLSKTPDQRVSDQPSSELTPEQFRALRARQEAPSRVKGGLRTPPAPEYGPRRVKTIEEEAAEAAEAEPSDEDVADLGGTGLEE